MATIDDVMERNRSAYQKTSAAFFWAGLFTLLPGLMFLISGIVALSSGEHGIGYFAAIFGILLVGWGVAQFVSSKRMRQK